MYVKRNIEARSCNHCCSGKSNRYYILCVCVRVRVCVSSFKVSVILFKILMELEFSRQHFKKYSNLMKIPLEAELFH